MAVNAINNKAIQGVFVFIVNGEKTGLWRVI
jgi:hypothetical protein